MLTASRLTVDSRDDNHASTSPIAKAVNALFMARLTLDALWRLAFYDAMCWLGFAKAYRFVRKCRTRSRLNPRPDIVERVVWAVDEACVWYFKRAFCLQRSATCAWMLRRQGVAADLVIGFRPVPIDSHAWVEVGGEIVNDRPQYQRFFRVLDRL
jgi:hypothetical protein